MTTQRLYTLLTFAFLLTLAALSSGCASSTFENRIACTVTGEAVVLSQYGGIGVSSQLTRADSERICGKRE